jgi:hypothetical protein
VAKKQPSNTLKIDNVDYKVDELSDTAKSQLQNVQLADAEIARLNMQLALAKTARNTYMHALSSNLPKKVVKKA